MKKHLFLSILSICTVLIFSHSSYSQGIAVNTDGSTADPSAMLDVKSTNKGMLVPRVASTASITSPVTGLLIYQTNAPAGFYYYSGASWLLLQNSAAIVSSSNGGAGTVSGILKANGSGTVSAAVAGTDYLTPTGSAAALTNFPTLNQNTTGNAATVTTDANLTGDITSVGNADTIANTVSGGNRMVKALGSATTGTIPTARLGSNSTGGASVFLNADGAFATPPASNVFGYGGLLANNATISGSNIVYTAADGSAINLPRATTAGQYLIILDNTPLSSGGTAGVTLSTTGGDLIFDENQGTLVGSLSIFSTHLVSDGSGHWYTVH